MNELKSEKSVPLSPEQSRMMIQATVMDMSDGEKAMSQSDVARMFPEGVPFPIGVVTKRIDAMKLPISFTLGALLMTSIMPDRAAGVVIMLIDLLSEYEGQVVTVKKVAQKYPFGFYSEDALIERIDELKADPAKEKFGYVY